MTATPNDRELVKRDVDRMIDYRKSQRPHDMSDIRVNVERLTMHKGLLPGMNYPGHLESKDLPVSLLYRGYRVVSIPGQKALKAEESQRRQKNAPVSPSAR